MPEASESKDSKNITRRNFIKLLLAVPIIYGVKEVVDNVSTANEGEIKRVNELLLKNRFIKQPNDLTQIKERASELTRDVGESLKKIGIDSIKPENYEFASVSEEDYPSQWKEVDENGENFILLLGRGTTTNGARIASEILPNLSNLSGLSFSLMACSERRDAQADFENSYSQNHLGFLKHSESYYKGFSLGLPKDKDIQDFSYLSGTVADSISFMVALGCEKNDEIPEFSVKDRKDISALLNVLRENNVRCGDLSKMFMTSDIEGFFQSIYGPEIEELSRGIYPHLIVIFNDVCRMTARGQLPAEKAIKIFKDAIDHNKDKKDYKSKHKLQA